jgi:polysaccharide biosynthesis protein PslH
MGFFPQPVWKVESGRQFSLTPMRILFISPWFPSPPSNGTKIRLHYLLQALASKHEVHLLSFIRDGEQVDRDHVESWVQSVVTIPWKEYNPGHLIARLAIFSPTPRSLVDIYSRDMATAVHTCLREKHPELIIASQISTARYISGFSAIAKIFEEVELGSLLPRVKLRGRLPAYRQELTWRKSVHYTRNLVRRYSAWTVVSDIERSYLQDLVNSQTKDETPAYAVIPNGVDCQAFKPGLAQPETHTLIYNGSLTFSANYQAVAYFLKEIYPVVRNNTSDTRFIVTGSTQGVNLKLLQQDPSVHFTGFVPDVRTVVASAAMCVAPILSGGGTRLKILEAMALGTPVVTTTKGAEGIQATHDKHLLIADNPQDFVAQIKRLFDDPGLRQHIASEGRKLVEELYCWDTITPKFLSLVDHVKNAGTRWLT